MNLRVLAVFGILSGTEAEKVPEAVIIAVFRTPVSPKNRKTSERKESEND